MFMFALITVASFASHAATELGCVDQWTRLEVKKAGANYSVEIVDRSGVTAPLNYVARMARGSLVRVSGKGPNIGVDPAVASNNVNIAYVWRGQGMVVITNCVASDAFLRKSRAQVEQEMRDLEQE